jgi:ABC-type transporter Mla maintaining outer membrane lipid asymmetry permease subunit MlaE
MFAILVRIPRRLWRPRAVAEQLWFVAAETLFPALLLT